MKKFFTLTMLLLCAVVGAKAQTVIFSMSSVTGPTDNLASGASSAVTATFAQGGSALVYNGKSSEAALVNKSNQVNLGGSGASYLKITLPVSLAVGDIITLTGDGNNFYFNNSDSKPESAGTFPFTITEGSKFVGGKVVYFWKGSNSRISAITITRPAPAVDEAEPSITIDLNNETPYSAKLGVSLELSIEAAHYTGFQWYTCDSEGNNAEAISGATFATYEFTPTASDLAAGTKYFKCIVTNTNSTGATTVTSKIATVNITASTDASVKSVVVVANGTYTATADGTAYSATIGGTTSATVTITPNDETAVVSCGETTGAAGKAINVSATAGTQLSFSVTAGVTTVNYTLDITKAPDKTATNNAYYLTVDENIYGGQQIVGDAITMTFSNASNGTFVTATADNYINEKDANYIASTAGNGQNGSASGISGTWYKFSPTINGTLTVGAVINKDRQLYIYKNDKNTKITEGVSYWASGTATLNEDLKASGKVYGLITLHVTAGDNYFFSVGGSKMGFYGFQFEPDIEIAVTSVGYRTFCSDKALDFTGITALTAYTASASAGTVTFNKVTGKVPANTGLLIKGETASIPVVSSAAAIDNVLIGVTKETTVNESGIFVLMAPTSSPIGFYKTTAASFTVGANTAYLPASVVSGARMFIGFDDNEEVTGINALLNEKGEMVNDKFIYNLNGQRVKNAKKGLYIKNGKKIFVK